MKKRLFCLLFVFLTAASFTFDIEPDSECFVLIKNYDYIIITSIIGADPVILELWIKKQRDDPEYTNLDYKKVKLSNKNNNSIIELDLQFDHDEDNWYIFSLDFYLREKMDFEFDNIIDVIYNNQIVGSFKVILKQEQEGKIDWKFPLEYNPEYHQNEPWYALTKAQTPQIEKIEAYDTRYETKCVTLKYKSFNNIWKERFIEVNYYFSDQDYDFYYSVPFMINKIYNAIKGDKIIAEYCPDPEGLGYRGLRTEILLY